MKLKPRIKVVLAEKDVKQVEIAKYYLEQTGEEVTPKRVKSISNTISRYARGEFNPSVLMKAKRIIVMLLVLCLLPVAAFARDEGEQNLMKLSPRTEAKLEAIRKGEWGREDNLLTYLADTYRDNRTLQFVKRNDKLLFGAGTIIGFSLYYIFSQPNKAAQGKAAGKVFRQLKKLF